MIRAKVFLNTRLHDPELLFEYDFVGEPVIGDEIHEDAIYTITARFWKGGKLCLTVTDMPTRGVIKASSVTQTANVVAGKMVGMEIDTL